MKVSSIATFVVGTPWRELTFVELETNTGLVGVGEVRMVNKTETLLACIRELGERYVIGSDPFNREQLATGIQWTEYGRPGEVAQSTLAAFDMAYWDLIGKALGEPVWKLLGGQVRDSVPAYANGWYQGERDPQLIADLARAVVARGYRGLKLDPFGASAQDITSSELRRSIELVAAVRDAIGPDISLMIEMHGRFRASAARRVAGALAEFDPAWLEEPVPPTDIAGLRSVRESTSLPIALGERNHTLSEFTEVIEGGLIDVVQADVAHFGGITGIHKLAAWTGVYNLALAPHNVCGPVGTAANVHLGIAIPGFSVLEHFNDFADTWVLDLVDTPFRVDETTGAFGLPTAPGLGVTLDRDACLARPRTQTMFNLFAPGWERRGSTASVD